LSIGSIFGSWHLHLSLKQLTISLLRLGPYPINIIYPHWDVQLGGHHSPEDARTVACPLTLERFNSLFLLINGL